MAVGPAMNYTQITMVLYMKLNEEFKTILELKNDQIIFAGIETNSASVPRGRYRIFYTGSK
jgi:hypothetical protein